MQNFKQARTGGGSPCAGNYAMETSSLDLKFQWEGVGELE